MYYVEEEMSEASGIENIKVVISTNLTKILMLYGRLSSDYNARYLPVTVSSIVHLISELEEIEKRYYGFSEILVENIQRRENYSKVFFIPDLLQKTPTINGLRQSLYQLMRPLIKNYVKEEKQFLLHEMNSLSSDKTKQLLLNKARNNSEFLSAYCQPKDFLLLSEFRNWCETEVFKESRI
jgi:hypothetical protein